MKYTKKRGDKLCELLASGMYSVDDCCKMVGIVKQTLYNWKKTNMDFLDQLNEAEDLRLDVIKERAISGLYKLVDIYEYEEVKTEYEPADPKNPNAPPKLISMTRTKKKIMPNKAAIDTTLFNLYPHKFKNKAQIDHTNNGDTFDFSNFLTANNTIPDEQHDPNDTPDGSDDSSD